MLLNNIDQANLQEKKEAAAATAIRLQQLIVDSYNTIASWAR